MRDSSVEIFNQIKKGFGTVRGLVFGAFWEASESLCDLDAARLLNRPINTITPRRGELERMGYLLDGGVKTGPNGTHVHFYTINPACLRAGFEPKPLKDAARPKRIPLMTVRQAAKVLAAARRGTKQKPAVKRMPLPLFE